MASDSLWPRMNIMDPVQSAGWEVWDGWLFWVWKFRDGWWEWIPCYPHLLAIFTNQHLALHGHLGVEVIKAIHTHTLSMMQGLWLEFVGCTIDELDIHETTDEMMNYMGNVVSKSDWYYNSVPGFGSWVALLTICAFIGEYVHPSFD